MNKQYSTWMCSTATQIKTIYRCSIICKSWYRAGKIQLVQRHAPMENVLQPKEQVFMIKKSSTKMFEAVLEPISAISTDHCLAF